MSAATSSLATIRDKVAAGERLSPAEGLWLLESADLLELGRLANLTRERRSGNRAYYIVNRHINYTNACVNRCRFCAFSRDADAPDAYVMTVPDVLARVEEMGTDGVSEFHLVGGLHPNLPFLYHLDLLSTLRERYPGIHLQAFTAVEIAHLARLAGLSVRDCLLSLQEGGLGSLPGGGAEVFSSRVRSALCPQKLGPAEWLEVMRTAHAAGLRSNATLLYGHMETPEEIIDHLVRLRELQDETGGFLAFIPLAFHPENTPLSGEIPSPPSVFQDLSVLAIGRLMLDNFDHVKTFWIMVSPKVAQLALSFGADDVDGTVVQERITHAAGARTPEGLTEAEIRRLIVGAGREPVRRDTLYQEV